MPPYLQEFFMDNFCTSVHICFIALKVKIVRIITDFLVSLYERARSSMDDIWPIVIVVV